LGTIRNPRNELATFATDLTHLAHQLFELCPSGGGSKTPGLTLIAFETVLNPVVWLLYLKSKVRLSERDFKL